LIGATTENPSFELNAALLSRCQVVSLTALTPDDLSNILSRAEDHLDIQFQDPARDILIQSADGDARYLLNMVERVANLADGDGPITADLIKRSVRAHQPRYDKSGDQHYDLISALHKAVRGSDVDGALYWLARMLAGGEDPRFIARRLTRMAVEDIGLADPRALRMAMSGWELYDRLGTPEGELGLAQVVVYLASAPKSDGVYSAFKQAKIFADKHGSPPPPDFSVNAPTDWMKGQGRGKGYYYDHDQAHGVAGQNYFPDGVERQQFYDPPPRGFEREVRDRLNFFAKKRAEFVDES
jgi:putative ATPase